MPRYATIITADDGHEVVSAIGEFEGLPRRAGCVEEIAPGVRIGMVRSGSVEGVAGFGFPHQGIDARAIGIVTAKLKAGSEPGPLQQAASSGEPASPKPRRAKPRKKPARRKAGKARAAAKPASDAVARG
ncbi:hypothetical protein [Mesorhizobium sp. B1-1-8]|uniref:hypothetical protein n=1 Tax=Mesorhizobium sp. B1-1-8 TaxID=2589976 RepID=UPI001129995F|nr:hypothetical protein [Mesorhizobium sp. B1-1-8]UCI06285.1 hypothetical protein FJ974_21055 [Mesorhizobium sp. B1-1-8]